MLFTQKKAQGLSMSTIVVAALALLVLIILSVIFVGRMGRVNDNGRECVQRGGSCYDATGTCRDYGEFLIPHPDADCLTKDDNGNSAVDSDKICCIQA